MQAGLLRVKLSHMQEINNEREELANRYGLGMPKGSLPITETLADEIVSLPMYTGMTQEEQNIVINCINKWSNWRKNV